MLLSFFTLALTGMSLKFSYTGWAQMVSHVLGGFESMGTLHRAGGLTLFSVFTIHLWDVVRQKRRSGMSWFRMLTGSQSILFTLNDVKQIGQSVRWFFGLGPRPSYGVLEARLRLRNLEARAAGVLREIKRAQDQGDAAGVLALQREKMELDRSIRESRKRIHG